MRWRRQAHELPGLVYMTCAHHMDLGPGREFNENMNTSALGLMATGHPMRPVCLACQVGATTRSTPCQDHACPCPWGVGAQHCEFCGCPTPTRPDPSRPERYP